VAASVRGWSQPLAACRFVHAQVMDESKAGQPIPIRGFRMHPLQPGSRDGLLLRWPQEVREAAGFGFAFGNDYREFGNISVRLAKSGKLLDLVTVSMAPRFDPYFVPLSKEDALAASREAILLRADSGSAERSVLSVDAALRNEAPSMHPFLLVPGALPPLGEYSRRMRSLDVIQDFDWRAGCVTEGLFALGETRALQRYLRLFLTESPRAATDIFRRGVEQTLPAAAIARLMPNHEAVRDAMALWQQRRNAQGTLQDGSRIVAETNYTVAYPMTVLGVMRGNEEFKQTAINQLRAARDRLVDDKGNVFLRHDERTGERTYLGWARGVAWYALGMAAVLDTLPASERPQDLLEELRRALDWAIAYQRGDGLFCGFLPEAAVAPDTSGTAGIGAALRIGQRLGIARPTWEQVAQRALQGCIGRLSVHGFLTGVSQSNKREGGPPFQRSAHRVSMQYAMGFLGVLLAESRKQRSAG
jgi:unsaturated rhamnogalacturonyl hydrolase